MAHAINSMLDHIHLTDRKLAQMAAALRALGAEADDLEIPDIEACEITSTAPGEEAPQQGQQEPPVKVDS